MKKTEGFIRSVISPVRQRAGLGYPPDKFTTNRSERKSGVLQDCVKGERGTAKIDEYTLVKTLEKLVNSLGQELELVVLDKGEYQLRPEFRHLVVTGDKWNLMSVCLPGSPAAIRVNHRNRNLMHLVAVLSWHHLL